MRYAMAHTQNEWRIYRCWQQAEKKNKDRVRYNKKLNIKTEELYD